MGKQVFLFCCGDGCTLSAFSYPPCRSHLRRRRYRTARCCKLLPRHAPPTRLARRCLRCRTHHTCRCLPTCLLPPLPPTPAGLPLEELPEQADGRTLIPAALHHLLPTFLPRLFSADACWLPSLLLYLLTSARPSLRMDAAGVVVRSANGMVRGRASCGRRLSIACVAHRGRKATCGLTLTLAAGAARKRCRSCFLAFVWEKGRATCIASHHLQRAKSAESDGQSSSRGERNV